MATGVKYIIPKKSKLKELDLLGEMVFMKMLNVIKVGILQSRQSS